MSNNYPLVDYATNIALIDEETMLVDNIIWGFFYSADQYASAGYMAVVIDDLAVTMGDTYNPEDGRFYRDGTQIVKTYNEIYNDELESLDNFIIDALYEDILDEIDEFAEE